MASAFASEKAAGHGGAAKKAHGGKAHWGYDGPEGPEHWGELAPGNRACSLGFQQSPIDLAKATPAQPGTIGVAYQPTSLRIVNNGHTIQCNTDPGSTANIDGRDFNLLQFHFHHPSEHAMDGKRFDMEAHFVHVGADGTLAVLGVFIEPGAGSNLLAPIWTHMPHAAGPEVKISGTTISPVDLLPNDRRYFRYLGSLTTPPCSQKVIWSVFRSPVQASSRQVGQFAQMFPMNARPLQPLHRRLLLGST